MRQVLNSRGKNLNLLLAISPSAGIVYFEIVEGTVKRDVFEGFLENLSAVVGEEFGCTIIMDNAPIHGNCETVYDHHRIKKLPPYSPMLNAVEYAFSTLKAAVKRQLNERMNEILDRGAAAAQNLPLTTYRSRILRQLVTSTVEGDTVTQEMCNNWHNRVLGFVAPCLERHYNVGHYVMSIRHYHC